MIHNEEIKLDEYKKIVFKRRVKIGIALLLSLQQTYVHAEAETVQHYLNTFKKSVGQLIAPQPTDAAEKVRLSQLTNFQLDTSRVELPTIQAGIQSPPNKLTSSTLTVSLNDAILQALQRRPEISQSIANVAGQSANIDIAKAQYYPQISGGLSSANLTKNDGYGQVVSLTATQMLYDFGKVKSSVDIEQAKLAQQQAKTLVSIDDIAYQVADAIVNIKRYKEITKIAEQQIQGVARIAEIANLRAKAGISSQADPVQAQSTLEASISNKIAQENFLKQYQQKLKNLLGYDVSTVQFEIPEEIIKGSQLYEEPNFTQIPKMIAAQGAVQIAQFQKKQQKLSTYPTLSVKGSVNQAIDGINPNNYKDDGFYNSIMLEASSHFYQGGSTKSQIKAASYAEEAAKAQVNATYLDIIDQINLIRENIQNKQKLMVVLAERKETTKRTKELYQEQYKLGTRTVLDLLNAEQAIHSAAQEIETSRYDIYSSIVQYISVTGRSRDLYDLNHTAIQGFEVQP